MMLSHFTTVVAVEEGREEALRKTLAELGTGTEGPFQRVAGTHMARLYVLDHYGGSLHGPPSHRTLTPALLVLSAVVDGPAAAWVEKLPAEIGLTAEAVWNHCRGFPGTADARAFTRWLLDHELAPIFPLVANNGATVAQVREGLELRARLGEFAARFQGAPPTTVRAAYREMFVR